MTKANHTGHTLTPLQFATHSTHCLKNTLLGLHKLLCSCSCWSYHQGLRRKHSRSKASSQDAEAKWLQYLSFSGLETSKSPCLSPLLMFCHLHGVIQTDSLSCSAGKSAAADMHPDLGLSASIAHHIVRMADLWDACRLMLSCSSCRCSLPKNLSKICHALQPRNTCM